MRKLQILRLSAKTYAFVFAYAQPYADSGNADTQRMISLVYQCGLGVERDLSEAEEFLLKAANHLV